MFIKKLCINFLQSNDHNRCKLLKKTFDFIIISYKIKYKICDKVSNITSLKV